MSVVRWPGNPLSFPGIVKQDPALPDDGPLPLPAARPKNAIFEDEEKSKVRGAQALEIGGDF